MGLSVAIVGWLGSTAFGAAIGTTAVSVIGGAISGAIVGAAVGGISAAIMGGDIGKGMLYGAVGGAVMGGISGYLGATGSVSSVGTEGSTVAGPTAPGGSVVTQTGQTVVPGTDVSGMNLQGAIPVQNLTPETEGFLSGVSDDTIAKVGTEAVGGVAKGLLAATDTSAEDAAETSIAINEANRLGRIEEIKQQGLEQRAGLREEYDIRGEQRQRQADTLARLKVGA